MLLDAKNLSFSYRDRPVLRGVNLCVSAGEVVSLLGPNASGKSTLIRVLLGQLRGAGSIAWDGRPLGQWRRRALARRIAYMAQLPAWEPGQSVADVLRLGRTPYLASFGIESDRDIEVVREVSRQLGIVELIHRPMDSLSGGQRQRVFIARCLVQEPKALLLDEPNTFLDLRHQVEIGKLMMSLARDRGIGVLMASHDLNLAGAFCDRMVLLSEGQVAADGPPAGVLRPDLLEGVYGVKLARIEREGRTPVIVPEV